MRADKMDINAPVRMLILGYPGNMKTGSLACLADAGFKLRVLNYGGNPESLIKFTKPENRKNIDVVTFEDPIAQAGATLGLAKPPTAFIDGFRMLDQWRYPDPDGDEIVPAKEVGGKTIPERRYTNLGASKDWGPDHITILDGLTGQGEAAFSRAMSIMNKTPLNRSQPMWGLAIDEQLKFIKKLLSQSNRHHVIVISHIKMIGPKDIERDDSDLTKEIKERAASMVPTRMYPKALGWELPQSIAGEFPTVIQLEQGKITVEPRKEIDLKVPVLDRAILKGLKVQEGGLLTIFKALGANPPGAK